jgi:hypothetical protein
MLLMEHKMKIYDHTWLIAEWERMGRPEVECLPINNILEECPDPLWVKEFQYRIKSKPWINWEHVSDDVVAICTNGDGKTRLYDSYPTETYKEDGWRWDIVGRADLFLSFTQGTCDWRDSLVMRPVVIGDK